MRIVFAGTPEFAVPSLNMLVAYGHEVVGVITREDAPLGRKRVLTPSPVAVAAEAHGLPVLKTNRLGAGATEWVAGLAPELGVIVAYGGLVREPLLSLPTHGWINLHFSELPRWRGAAPVQRALMAGELRLGVTVFRLVDDPDAGDVLTRDAKDYLPGQPAGFVLADLANEGTATLARAVQLLGDRPDAGEPQQGEASYAHKLTREDGRLDVGASTKAVLAHWAGVTPEPGAWLTTEGKLGAPEPLKIHELARAADRHVADTGAPAGTVELIEGRAILRLPDGALHLVRVQPAGKPAMDGQAWLRGRGGKAVLG